MDLVPEEELKTSANTAADRRELKEGKERRGRSSKATALSTPVEVREEDLLDDDDGEEEREVNAFKERRALALTLNDAKTAVDKLHRMVNVLVGILIVILILGITTSKFLIFLSSQLVAMAFIFVLHTCKIVFEAVIFLFVVHPFDVGDHCEIDGVQMMVVKMNILTTVFRRFDNQTIIISNHALATKTIGNYHRSPDMCDTVEFMIRMATPAEKIALFKQRITSYIENKSEHWYPSPMIVFKDFEDVTRVRITIRLTHRMNHQDMGEQSVRRSLVLEEMAKIFKELDINTV